MYTVILIIYLTFIILIRNNYHETLQVSTWTVPRIGSCCCGTVGLSEWNFHVYGFCNDSLYPLSVP